MQEDLFIIGEVVREKIFILEDIEVLTVLYLLCLNIIVNCLEAVTYSLCFIIFILAEILKILFRLCFMS